MKPELFLERKHGWDYVVEKMSKASVHVAINGTSNCKENRDITIKRERSLVA